MKRKVTILLFISLFLALGSVSMFAQTKEEEEKKKQEMMMQKKLEEEKLKAIEEREKIRVRGEDLERAARDAREAYAEAWTLPNQVMVSTGTDLDNIYFIGGSQSSSSLQYTKNVKEASFTKEFEFEIEKDAERASINVNGMCKEGEIRIKITMPSGKTYTEVLIDEYGSVNWSKTFNIDEENGTKTGDWRFQVIATDATGNFRLSLKSY